MTLRKLVLILALLIAIGGIVMEVFSDPEPGCGAVELVKPDSPCK